MLTQPIPITTTTLLEPTSGKTPGTGSMQLPLPVKRRSNYTERPMSTRSRFGRFILRHHRVGGENLLPSSAKSAKNAAIHLTFSVLLFPPVLPSQNILILAIEAEPREGLRDIFIGNLKQDPDSGQLYWERLIPFFTPKDSRSSREKLQSTPSLKRKLPLRCVTFRLKQNQVTL